MNLVEFQTDKPGDKGGRSRNGRNNFARDLLSAVSICSVNAIIHCTKIRCCSNKINVVVGVIVFLKLARAQAITSQRRWGGQFASLIITIVI